MVSPRIVQGSSEKLSLNLEPFQVVRCGMPGKTFGIGEAARHANVSPDLIRYYERVGVLPRAPRTAGGFRYYTEETVARLLFARNAIRFGFTSKQLAGFLKARDSGRPPCNSVRAAGQRLLQEMDEHLVRLNEARAAIAKTLALWDARLERTPAGTPAHLLTMVPAAPLAVHRRLAPKRNRITP
jgi:MerR family transcriptional regulator, copper efflux regulator